MAGGGIKINNTSIVGGADGKTPVFKIENGKLYNSYDNGASWYELGQVKGEQGPQGEQGIQGIQGIQGETQDLTDYVKNTDYATYDKAGILQIANLQGLVVDDKGKTSVKRYGGSDPIGFFNNAKRYNDSSYLLAAPAINKIVKSGLAYADIGFDFSNETAKGNWTEEEKASARNTIGAGRKLYRHDIETGTGSGYIISTNSEVYSGFVGGSSENVKEIIYVCVVEQAGIFIGFGTFSDTGFSGIRLLQNGGYSATSPAINVNSDIVTEL